jgi:hypothetical protein
MRRVLARADQFFAAHGVRVERVMTDNAKAYRNARVFRAAAHLLRMFTRSGQGAPRSDKVRNPGRVRRPRPHRQGGAPDECPGASRRS